MPTVSPEGPRIRVGSDSSGVESTMEAFHGMGIGRRVTLEFACDTDADCRAFIAEVHKPRMLFKDVTKRNLENVPAIDIYTAGFPCHPFSLAREKG